jgi:hypothetical protein
MNSQNLNFQIQDDDTKYRILGNTNLPLNKPENYQYTFIYSATAKAKIKPTPSQEPAANNNSSNKWYLIHLTQYLQQITQ